MSDPGHDRYVFFYTDGNIPQWDFGARLARDRATVWSMPNIDYTVGRREPEPVGLLPPGRSDEPDFWDEAAVGLACAFGYLVVGGLVGMGLQFLGLPEMLAAWIGLFWLPIGWLVHLYIKLRRAYKKFAAARPAPVPAQPVMKASVAVRPSPVPVVTARPRVARGHQSMIPPTAGRPAQRPVSDYYPTLGAPRRPRS